MFSRLAILVRIAAANLFGSVLNVLVGALLFAGAAVLVIVTSVFGTLDRSLSKSIIGSVTGHVHVYSAKSKDALEVYGRFDGSDSNLAPIDDFKSLKEKLMKVPNVQSVVPMGSSGALMTSGNTVDLALERVRGLYRRQKEGGANALSVDEFKRQSDNAKGHVQHMIALLAHDMEKVSELGTKDAIEPEERDALAKASSPEFWAGFDDDPYGHLELLENQVAPLVADADLLYIRYLGTDLEAYQKTFDRLQVTNGQKVPQGRRGILLPGFFYEEFMKLKNARRLDKMRDAREAGRVLSDTSDKELQRWQKENISQTREIVLQLDGIQTKVAVEKLQKLLGKQDGDLAVLLSEFFKVTDASFDERYKFFYAELAPMLALYRVKVGDPMTLRAFNSGSLQAVNVRLYGIFDFKGLEKSPLAGQMALIDLVSFRELYGFLTPDRAAELNAMKEQTQARKIDRATAEDELFGGGGEPQVSDVKESEIVEAPAKRQERESVETKQSRVYTQDEIESGVVLDAAITLVDGSKAAQAQAMKDIERALAETKPAPDSNAIAQAQKLADEGKLPFSVVPMLAGVIEKEKARGKGQVGATSEELIGLQQALLRERAGVEPLAYEAVEGFIRSARPEIWVVSWSTAAGTLGQTIDVFGAIIWGMVFAFGLAALLVVTLGVTIATLQRTATIGTLRAIGAYRSFVVSMVFIETMVLTLVFGMAGALAGAGFVKLLASRGIPAFRDELYFFFSGPVLRPELSSSSLVLSVSVTLFASLLAVIVPVFLAIRVAPVTAMQTSE